MSNEPTHRVIESASPDRGLEGFEPRITPVPDPRLSRSLEYGVAILESFTANRPVLRISELADMVGISRSTTHRYATTLVELGFLEQDGKRRYRLAHNAARAGMALIETVRRENPARAILEDLREQTRHTVSLGLLDRAQSALRLPATCSRAGTVRSRRRPWGWRTCPGVQHRDRQGAAFEPDRE